MSIELGKNKEDKRFNWSTLFFISLASIILGVYRDGIASLFPFLQNEFMLSRAQMGIYISFLYFVASLVSVYTGQLVDQKGSKWGMLFGLFLVGILLILHSIASNFTTLLILASFTGFGLSINLPAANKGINEHFPKKWQSTATGIWSTAFPAGGLLAASFLPILGLTFGWRKAILLPGVLALVGGLIIIIFYRDKKRKNKSNEGGKNKTGFLSFWENLNKLIHNVDLIAISVYGLFLGAASGSITSHFTLFLYMDYGLTENIAGLGFAVAQLGSILTRPAWGLACDHFLNGNKRKGFLIMGSIFFLVTISFNLYYKTMNTPIIMVLILAFIMGSSGRGWQGVYYSSISDMVEKEQVGAAVGLSSLFARFGILLAPPIFGYIADLRNSYDLSWLLIGIIMLLSSIAQFIFYKKSQ